MSVQFIVFNMADTELSEELSQSLARKPRAVSVVWDYFGLKANENGTGIVTEEQKPVCRTCHRSVPAKGGWGAACYCVCSPSPT